MSPSTFYRRAATISGVAASSFAIAMAATPAQAAGTLLPGGLCTPLTLIPASLGLTCENGVLKTITSALPTPAPSSSAPGGATSPAPDPLGGVVNGVTGTVDGVTKNLGGLGGLGGTVNSVTGAVGGTLNGLTGGAGGSTSPSTSPGGTGSATTAGSTGTSTPAQPGVAGSGAAPTASSTTGAGTPASSLLGPAAAFLPGTSLANFADLSSGSYANLMPLADSIPSPLIASPESRLAAVQAPLIAAGEKAAQNTDSLLGRFSGKALPGLLVVIGTALVAAVGAGNLRAWQTRMASGGLRLRLPRRRGVK